MKLECELFEPMWKVLWWAFVCFFTLRHYGFLIETKCSDRTEKSKWYLHWFQFLRKKVFFHMFAFSFSFFNCFCRDCEVPNFWSQNHGKDHLIPCKSLQVNELVLWSTKNFDFELGKVSCPNPLYRKERVIPNSSW